MRFPSNKVCPRFTGDGLRGIAQKRRRAPFVTKGGSVVIQRPRMVAKARQARARRSRRGKSVSSCMLGILLCRRPVYSLFETRGGEKRRSTLIR